MGILDAPAAPLKRVSTLPGSAAATPSTYDAVRNLWNGKPAQLRNFRAKLAAADAGSAECRIVQFGTSIAAGQNLTDKPNEAPPNVLRKLAAAAGIPIAGGGPALCSHGDSGLDSRWSFTGTWQKFNPGATDRTAIYQSASAGGTATYTSDLAGTIAELWFSTASGTIGLTIDGAAPSSGVTITGGTYSGGVITPTAGTSIGKITVTGLSNATHVIVATRTAGAIYIHAACVRQSTGLSVANWGSGGARLSDTNLGQPYDLRSTMLAWAPHLAIVDYMTNEAYTGITAAVFKTNLTSLCTALYSAGIDVLLIGEIPAGGTMQAGGAMDLTAYRGALYEVAASFDYPVLDLFDRWGTYTLANTAGLMSDSFHPNAVGAREYARAMRNVVLG